MNIGSLLEWFAVNIPIYAGVETVETDSVSIAHRTRCRRTAVHCFRLHSKKMVLNYFF